MPIKTLVQRVNSASLLLDNKDQWASINKGILVFVSILKETSAEDVEKCAQQLCEAKILENQATLQSDDAASLGIVIIPQASLAGKLKSKSVQYHALIDKQMGESLFKHFVTCMGKYKHAQTVLVAGTYGNTQGLKVDASSGPYSHIFEW